MKIDIKMKSSVLHLVMLLQEPSLSLEKVMKIISMSLKYVESFVTPSIDFIFLFKITSIIIFLGSVINVLYYLGVMQYIIGKIAWLMQKCLDTTAAEVCIVWT